MQKEQTNEKKIRINIKQSAKKIHYWDLTVKGDTVEEVDNLLSKTIKVANKRIKELDSQFHKEV